VEKKERTRRNNKKIEFTFNREVLGILLAAFAMVMLCALAGLPMGSAGAFLGKSAEIRTGNRGFPLPSVCAGSGAGVYPEPRTSAVFQEVLYSAAFLFLS
jgi:DNA segregation ATPase FtsK/SpoIIIE, S-DNA-T family